MAGAESSEKPVISLKLLFDKKKRKVVLAETGKDFVDVLFSLLTLPIGTIVRLLEKYRQNQDPLAATIGCCNNLYKSVFDLGIDDFSSEACKDMLLYPLNVKEMECRRLKLNVDDSVLKYYGCPKSVWRSSCQIYSNFSSSRCKCGELMNKELNVQQDVGSGEIFVSDKTLFAITDKMEVRVTSMSLTLKTLKDLGYTDTDQLQERIVDVDHSRVLELLLCLFCSDTPLSDVFLTRNISLTEPSLPLQEVYVGRAQSNKLMSITVFSKKLDKKVLYVESGKDFVDLLFTFLAFPLYSAWKITGSNILLGCITNLCESFKSSIPCRTSFTEAGMLPLYYSCQPRFFDVYYKAPESELTSFSKNKFEPVDPRCSKNPNGFVKEGKTFMVSDGLIITPTNLTSNMSQLKKWNISLDDIEVQVIDITKTEAIKLLRASFMTSTALNTVFGSLLP